MMFWSLLERGGPIRYRPDMAVEHHVEPWRLKRGYFLKLHFVAGRKFGQYQTPEYGRTILGVPPFMVAKALGQWWQTASMAARRKPNVLRQAMNGAHATGMVWGRYLRWRKGVQSE